jgi:stage II sporulation protein R
MKAKKLLIIEIALFVGIAAALLWGIGAVRTQQEISDKVVRLHVVANSDSEEDQALKLRVRDAILARTTALLEASDDRSEAEGLIRGQLLELEDIAVREITAAGYDYSVEARLAELDFPTREYESFTLPAGNYLALQVVIGEGEGKNWWCVVFPPLCTAAAAEVPASALAAGFSEEEVRLITEEDRGYVLKFKTLEWLEMLKEKLK